MIVYAADAVSLVITSGNTDVSRIPGTSPVGDIRFVTLGFAGELAFELDLPEAADVDVRLFDVAGRVVARLTRAALPAGRHRVTPSANRAALESGVYFARAIVRTPGGQFVRTARAVRLR